MSEKMTTYKKNRIVAAVTVNSIVLIVIIAAVLIYQIVQLSILAARRSAIEEQTQLYEQMIEYEEDSLEYYLSEDYLRQKAYEYGFIDSKK